MESQERVVSSPTEVRLAEERMLQAELVQEIVARKERSEGIKAIARELSIDRKTVKRWLGLGGLQPRRPQHRLRQLDRFAAFIQRRALEVGSTV
jgi:DNA invertase Pin-like site-specific DNA recombinase